MPLFSNKFSPCGPALRNKKPLFNTNLVAAPPEVTGDSVTINLSGQRYVFSDGSWRRGSDEAPTGEGNGRCDDCCRCLQEENRYLRNKCRALLTLISKQTFNSKNQEKEINRLRREIILLTEGLQRG